MLLSDSQINMRSLWLDMLFTPIDYIFVTCLTKLLSWLVGVQSRPYHCFCKCIIIILCKFISKSVIEFWVVTWAQANKSNIKKIQYVSICMCDFLARFGMHGSACGYLLSWNGFLQG